MTDIFESTPLWERDRKAMSAAVARHNELGEIVAAQHHGHLLKKRGEGDSLFMVFAKATDAAAAAVDLTERIESEPWEGGLTIRLRIAVHTAEMELRDEDYFGPDVNRCARIRAIANPGQVLVSDSVRQICVGDTTAGLKLLDLGEHRLKDLMRSERVHLLYRENSTPNLTPLRSLDRTPNNLPVRLTSFVGRTGELAMIASRLPTSRLVTLTGSPGSGKTRLATQAAAEETEKYPGGVWFVELSAIERGERVEAAIASALGFTPAGPDESPLSRFFKDRERCLLILDNCEHVLEDAAMTVQHLIRSYPRLNVLATSRQPLDLSGEVCLAIPPLPVTDRPDAMLYEDLASLDSFRLFVDRALARNALLNIDQTAGSDIAAICREVDGIPLAIEMAASFVHSLSLKQIRERLPNRMKMLKNTQRGVDARHSTIRAMIAWSYELLSEDEKLLFRRLSVFAGGWNMEAAESICASRNASGDDTLDVFDLLRALVEKSLVVTNESVDGSLRYRYLETIRDFASEALGDEIGGLMPAFYKWFLELARNANPHLNGPNMAIWLSRMDAESENFQRALFWAKEIDPPQILPLAHSLRRYWYRRGRPVEGSDWILQGLATTPEFGTILVAESLNVLATFQTLLGQYAEAKDSYLRALEINEQLGQLGLVAGVQVNLANLESDQGRYDEALDRFKIAENIYESLGDRLGAAIALENVGICELKQDRFDEAIAALNQCLPVLRKSGELGRIGHTLGNLGQAYAESGQIEHAREAIGECLAVCAQNLDATTLTTALLAMAWLGREQLPEDTAHLCGAVQQLFLRSGATPGFREFLQKVLLEIELKIGPSRLAEKLAASRGWAIEQMISEAQSLLQRLAVAHSP